MANDPTEPNKFKYTLNIRGVDEEELTNAPDGWLGTNISYKRDTKYWGLLRSLTLPMAFTNYAAGLLRREFYTYGILARVFIKIEKLIENMPYVYGLLYSGKLDFSKAKDTLTEFTTDAIQNDFSIQVDAYDSQDFAIPLDNTALTVTLPGLVLNETADFIFNGNTDQRSDAYFETTLVNNQQVSTQKSVQAHGFFATPSVNDPNYWDYKAVITNNVRVTGHIEGAVIITGFSSDRHFKIYLTSSNLLNSFVKTIFDYTAPNIGVYPFSVDFDFITTVNQGDELFFYFSNEDSADTNVGFRVTKGNFSFAYKTFTPATTCKAFRVYDIYTKLLQLMNRTSPNVPPQPVPNQSYLLTQYWRDLVITCSDSVRATLIGTFYQAGDTLQAGGSYLVQGDTVTYNSVVYSVGQTVSYVLGFDTFTGDGYLKQITSTPSIILNFSDFFQSIFALQGGQCGFGQEMGLAVLEDLSYFFRSGAGSLDLGVVNNFELTPAIDLLYNSIKVGYNDPQLDKLNATQAQMSEQDYGTDLLSPAKELNLISPIDAEPYLIETWRVVPQDSASSRSDNKPAFIYLKSTPEIDGSYLPLQMDAAITYSGVPAEYYNWKISPKQNLLRGGRYLHSIFDKMDGYTTRQTSALKSTSMIVTTADGRVSEKDDVQISDLGAKIFLPYYISCLTGLPVDAGRLLANTPYADMKLTYLDNEYRVFADEVGVDEAQNSAQTFKTLLTPGNNMDFLVH